MAPGLRELDISFCDVSDAIVPHCRQLRTLHARGSLLTPAAFDAQALPRLRLLDVRASDSFVGADFSALPHECRILPAEALLAALHWPRW